MALNLVAATDAFAFTRFLLPRSHLSPRASSCGRVSKIVRCMTATAGTPGDQTIVRRSANYKPPIWENDFIQSLSSNYVGETYAIRAVKLKENVRMMLEKTEEALEKLKLIDAVQRLGVSYHFEAEIKTILECIYNDVDRRSDRCNKGDLYATALEFRLLRQHGYNVPQEVFNSFKDKSRKFKESLSDDTKGLLSLYEASYLLMGGESVLEEARDFTTKHLKEYLKKSTDPNLDTLVSHALELPLHWRMQRMEARWYIDAYERIPDMNATLLEFAKLDFNMLQAIHQEDLKYVSRWWESTGWREKLPFARDRLLEAFLWALGQAFEPQFQHYRRMETILTVLITCFDDVYDIYGTLDELEDFTNAVARWDINAVEQLPYYMKICLLGFHTWINEIAYYTLKEHGVHNLPYVQKKWRDLCQCYLKEAKWFYSGYVPTLEEYLNQAWISVAAPILIIHSYFLSINSITNPITKEELECLEEYPDIIKWPSMIVRLTDDLGTSWDEIKRGDIPKSIQIYMHETGASAEDAQEYVKYLIREAWKKINETRVMGSPFNRTFVEHSTNIARFSQFMYQHGDGHGHDIGGKNKDRVTSLLIKPIPLSWTDI